MALKFCDRAAIDVAAVDGKAAVAIHVVFVFDGGIDVFAFHGAADSFFGSLMKSFAWTPTEISSFELFRGDDVDFFPCILAHVGDVKEVSIPAAAPRVAEPVSKDFGVLSVDERVIAGDGVACLLYTSPSPRDQRGSRMPSSA